MKPLKLEVLKLQNEITQLRLQVSARTQNLKILYAMIRSPKMCDLVYKTERKRLTEENFKKL